MTLLEFLINLLATQAKTLQRLAALLGEEELFELLEQAEDRGPTLSESLPPQPHWFEPRASSASQGKPVYTQLEGSVREFGLPAVLEFHLWAYPFYRYFIESNLDLNSPLKTASGSAESLITEAETQARFWVRRLPIHHEGLKNQAEAAAMVPWLRFRNEVLKKIGKRPFVSL